MNYRADIVAKTCFKDLLVQFLEFESVVVLTAEQCSLLINTVLETGMAPPELLMAAAEVGLFPTHQPPSDVSTAKDVITFLIRHLEHRAYCIRPAVTRDKKVLNRLETECWIKPLRTPRGIRRQRIRRHAEGQLVVCVDGAVAGVIYTQRLQSVDALVCATMDDVDTLHDPEGDTVQLLAINIAPDMQDRGLGDALLEFKLIHSSVQPETREVVAVTLCRSFQMERDGDPADYIGKRTELGVLADPILRFHELHGAQIVGLVPGYRPRDVANLTNGVLVRYDIRNRVRAEVSAVSDVAATHMPRSAWRTTLRGIITDCLGDAAGAFAFDRPLMEMGLDSAGLMALSEALFQRFGLRIPASLLFQHNTPDRVLAHIESQTEASRDKATEPRHRPSIKKPPAEDGREVAIIGMSCRLPGGIEGPEDLWQVLENGTCVISDRPADRWEWPTGIDPKGAQAGIDRGGFLSDVSSFDAAFFRISPFEAASMDPQQRLLLELSWHALEDAGYAPDRLRGSNTAVYIGASGSDYARLIDEARLTVETHQAFGTANSVAASRISYALDFNGPSLVIDTACSSSLVAVHEAVKSIRTGESDQALVGGIHLMLHPGPTLAYQRAGMLSPDGLCRSFDAGANGYVRSEGGVVVLLKRLSDALRDGDRIHGVIKGSACNHGGQTGGLTVPSPMQQTRLLTAAWRDAQVTPAHLSYIEAHGTGTPLGDPIEMRGIQGAIEQADKPNRNWRCPVGSIKSNLGHLEAAAGLAGMLKVLLAMRHQRLPASLHIKKLNPEFETDDSGLFIARQAAVWSSMNVETQDETHSRIAGVSSFGSGGTNAHVVLSEPPAPLESPVETGGGAVLFALSAQTPEQLRAYAGIYARWLSDPSVRALPLHRIAANARHSRAAMEVRWAVVLETYAQLITALITLAETPPPFARSEPVLAALVADTDEGAGMLQQIMDRGDLATLAEVWCAGVNVDWALLDGAPAALPSGVDLPRYPFAKTAYWLPGVPMPQSLQKDAVSATLLVPVWQKIASNADPDPLSNDTLIAGVPSPLRDALAKLLPGAKSLALGTRDLTAALSAAEAIDTLIWVVSDSSKPGDQDNLIAVFRMVKALLAAGYGQRSLDLRFVTTNGLAVQGGDVLRPDCASIHGFAGVLAEEQSQWSVSCLDLDTRGDGTVVLDDLTPLPDTGHDSVARRDGQWFHRRLGHVDASAQAVSCPYRQGGVYVVIGGAGGIGQAFTRHVLEQAAAQVIWIGRRAETAAIRDAILELAHLGPAPVYVQADATQPDALSAAVREVKQRFETIHGVIHAAVGPADQTIAAMDEDHFRDVLSAKTAACVNTADVFADEPLDFLSFFSSVVALEKPGGFGGYSAAGAFEDAYAQMLDQQRQYPVRVINWGHWAVGIADTLSDATHTRLRRQGMVPLQPNEAMATLDKVLQSPLPQVAVLKWRSLDQHPLVDMNATLTAGSVAPQAVLARRVDPFVAGQVDRLGPLSVFANPAIETALPAVLKASLQKLDLFDDTATLPDSAAPYLAHWLAASRVLINEANAKPTSQWSDVRRAHHDDPNLAAVVDLVDACNDAWPDILQGRRPATEVLFPNASMQRLEPIYRGNAVADFFNDLLADAVVADIEARLRATPDIRLRILEIGAGTGGTTARILPRLAAFGDRIETYAFTDVSKAFLFHAQETFSAQAPYLDTGIFDVESAPSQQGFEPQSYDIVIAANVLHATPNLRRTLANAKALLRTGGALVLNEVTGKSVFAHVTFGLLEGWWKTEDPALRIPGTPLLTAERWDSVLTESGFYRVNLPLPQAGRLGQQVIVAYSDGWIWAQTKRKATRPEPEIMPVIPDTTLDAIPVLETPQEWATGLLAGVIATTLRMQPDSVEAHEPLGNYGLDSILIVRITAELRKTVPDLDSSFLFQHQTIRDLASYLIEVHPDAVSAPQTAVATAPDLPVANPLMAPHLHQPVAQDPTTDAIAIVGMALRLPQADTAEEFWKLLSEGHSVVTEIPQDRWSLDGFFEPDPDTAARNWKSYSKWGAFLSGVTEFDPLFFNIAPKEVPGIDPQERLFLQTAWSALEDGGFTRARLADEVDHRVGVFVGVTRTGFDLFGPDLWESGQTVYPHTSFSSVANRLSFFLDARGPSVPVDTMCSSSLTAIHQACESLRRGECKIAITGGVNLYLHPSSYIGLSAARMLSPNGFCRSFGAEGDGFVPGEGVGALVLRPLRDAEAAGDRIIGVVRGTHVNHGGRTNGYSVPNPRAQAMLVRDALARANIDARDVSYLEAHGTGTKLGDPIEIAGLTEAFGDQSLREGPCAVGSVKSNIGHLEAAAGIAGVIKVLLQMRHKQVVPSLHSQVTNPGIDFAKTPFRVQQTLAPWRPPKGTKDLIAGVSSFGAGGANAHVILAQYDAQRADVEQGATEPVVITLSAHDKTRLRAYANRLRDAVAEMQSPNLEDIAYTLQTGREPMDCRLALVVSTADTLVTGLSEWLDGVETTAFIAEASVRAHRKESADLSQEPDLGGRIKDHITAREMPELATLWTRGAPIDWHRLYSVSSRSGHAPQNVSLPAYPFEGTSFWLPAPTRRAPVDRQGDTRQTQDNAPGTDARQKTNAIRKISLSSLTDDKVVSKLAVGGTKRTLSSLSGASSGSNLAQQNIPMSHIADGIVHLNATGCETAAIGVALNQLAADTSLRVAIVSGSEHTPAITSALTEVDVPVIVVDDAGDTFAGATAVVSSMQDATRLAGDMARAPAATLRALKRHLANPAVPELVTGPVVGSPWTKGYVALSETEWDSAENNGTQVSLNSPVVTLCIDQHCVAQITLNEREGRNTFTPDFVSGVLEAFDRVDDDLRIKAVVLTGFETYFACGGTREGLLAIQNGNARFTDEQSYARPLKCRVPVIAAMQGHAIGAGWAMGLFCDVTIYSEESVYQSPYLLYGFTPGAGSTLMFPHRLGPKLAQEILFGAGQWYGRDLHARGIFDMVLPRARVLAKAHGVARYLAKQDRAALIAQKDQLAAPLRETLPQVFERELALHDTTFVGNLDVVAHIDAHFGNSIPAAAVRPEIGPDPTSQSEGILRLLRTAFAEELQINSEHLHDDTAFTDMGLDSISAVVWVRKVAEKLNITLGATSVYNHPTFEAFTAYVIACGGQVANDVSNDTAAVSTTPEQTPEAQPAKTQDNVGTNAKPAVLTVIDKFPQQGSEPAPEPAREAANPAPVPADLPEIAIVGMSGQFPKSATPLALWQNLIAGRNCVEEIPAIRWSIDDYHHPDRQAPGKTVCRNMGALEGIGNFDPLFFNIAPAEAELMDPQQRLFLQSAWTAIEDAGYDPGTLSGTRCGVFVGCGTGDYHLLHGDRANEAYALTGESASMLPARIAYFLNLQGPCLAIDTACSASLVAIANACDSLALGHCETALAGGVYVLTGPDIHVKMSKAGMLSPSGTCFSFDQRADGFVPGEGVGAVLLKRHEDALRDGDDIHAVIRGWGVNQDGRSNGITAPNQDAQTRLQKQVYQRFGIDPSKIGLVEAHGTGTALGDPIEVEALQNSFRPFTSANGLCALGSVKSNIGHLATAAGIAGVVKVAMALKHQQIPPTLHCETLNPQITLTDSPFYLPTTLQPWSVAPGEGRLAAVSSFGFSGTNAHLVLREATAQNRPSRQDAHPMILPLSARTPERLRAVVAAVLAYLKDDHVPLVDLVHTYQTGRAAFKERLAVIADDQAVLMSTLQKFLSDEDAIADAGDTLICGTVVRRNAPSEMRKLQGNSDDMRSHLCALAQHWVKGGAVDWTTLGTGRRRHGLPTYPFECERYWADTNAPEAKTQRLKPQDDAWRPDPVPADVDWRAQLQRWFDQPLVIVSEDKRQRAEFEALVGELVDADGGPTVPSTRSCALSELDRAVQRGDRVIFLQNGDVVDKATLEILQSLPSGISLLLSLSGESQNATRVFDDLSAAGRRGIVIYQRGAVAEPRVFIRALLRHDPAVATSALHRVNLEGDTRLVTAPAHSMAAPDAMLIRKCWLECPASGDGALQKAGTLLVLATDPVAALTKALENIAPFNEVMVIGRSAKDALDAITEARMAQITHILDASDLSEISAESAAWTSDRIAFYQRLIAQGAPISLRHLTQDVQPFRQSQRNLAGAGMIGLVRMLQAEYPHLNARTIDLEKGGAGLASLILREFADNGPKTEICYRDGQRFASALAQAERVDTAAQPKIDPQGIYLISGGTNGVGLTLAMYLADLGARHLALIGETELPPQETWAHGKDDPSLTAYVRAKLPILNALRTRVGSLTVHGGSVANGEEITRFIGTLRETGRSIRGIIHAAGRYSDATVPSFALKPMAGMQAVWQAKAEGLEVLHQAVSHDPYDFFLVLSSMTGLMPRLARGAADYAMANTYADLFAAHRHAGDGGRTRSLIMSDWNNIGAITRVDTQTADGVRATFDGLGLRTFDKAEGCQLINFALSDCQESGVILGPVNPEVFDPQRRSLLQGGKAQSETDDFITRLERWEAAQRAIPLSEIMDVIDLSEIRSLPKDQMMRLHRAMFPDIAPDDKIPPVEQGTDEGAPEPTLADKIETIVCEVLKLRGVDRGEPLQDYGLDSISGMIVSTRLEKALDREVAPRLLIDHPTIDALCAHLAARVAV